MRLSLTTSSIQTGIGATLTFSVRNLLDHEFIFGQRVKTSYEIVEYIPDTFTDFKMVCYRLKITFPYKNHFEISTRSFLLSRTKRDELLHYSIIDVFTIYCICYQKIHFMFYLTASCIIATWKLPYKYYAMIYLCFRCPVWMFSK